MNIHDSKVTLCAYIDPRFTSILTDENGNLKELVALLEVESKKNSDQLRETKQKIERTTSECFCSKEDNLLTKLVASEKKLEQSELLEFEANEKLIIAEERNVSHQLLESKLAASQKKLQRYELLEFEAQEKLINTEERLEEEQTKSKESQQLLRQIIRSMYFQAELCKDQARDSWVSVFVSHTTRFIPNTLHIIIILLLHGTSVSLHYTYTYRDINKRFNLQEEKSLS